MLFYVLLLIVLFLAYSNGSNDNFKGVATLYGSQTASYRFSLIWTTIFTFLGAFISTLLAETLLKSFSGKGLVPDHIVSSPNFILAVSAAAGLTVLVATKVGMPISTTHGITGALVGAGCVAVGFSGVDFSKLGKAFVLPLLLSPILSAFLSWMLYFLFKNQQNSKLDIPHYISSAGVCFARGLNDAPKIAGLLLANHFLPMQANLLLIATAMIVGGWFNSAKIAETMSKKMTTFNPPQGLSANIITATLVTSASLFGLPVSTTHVSVGALYGIGIHTQSNDNRVVRDILLSWLLTLPTAAFLSALVYSLL